MKFTADTGEMHSAADKLAKQSEEYTSIYTRLLNTASTMGDAWKAPDNLAFVEQINGFLDELKAMSTHIEQASLALNQQASNYEAKSEDNTVGVKKLVN